MPGKYRIAVIGGGMAGLPTGARLSERHEVEVYEAEFQPGHHSTGRSAAALHMPFVNDVVHALTLGSVDFCLSPPKGFPRLARPVPFVLHSDHEHRSLIEEYLDRWSGSCGWLTRLDRDDLHRLVTSFRPQIQRGALDSRSMAVDVAEMLGGFRKMFLENGGALNTNERITDITQSSGGWSLRVRNRWHSFDRIVNAAGAWADQVAERCGVRKLGIAPMRRTCAIVDAARDVSTWPVCYSATEDLYFKPEGARLLVCPSDESRAPPADVQPEIIDAALTIDRLQQHTNILVSRPEEVWAGLRSFVQDRCPVLGLDPEHERFAWCAALGGLGIQTAPSYSQLLRDILESTPLTERQEFVRYRSQPRRQSIA